MAEVALQFTAHKIAGNNTSCLAVDLYHLQHLMPAIHLYVTQSHLPFHCLIGTDEQLLTSLAGGIESTLYLCASKRTVRKQPAIFTCERDTLRHTLGNNVGAYLRKSMYIAFAGTIVSPLDCIIEKTVS